MNYKLFEILVCFLYSYLLPILSYKISLITFRMTLVYCRVLYNARMLHLRRPRVPREPIIAAQRHLVRHLDADATGFALYSYSIRKISIRKQSIRKASDSCQCRFEQQSARAHHSPRGLRLVVLHADPHQLVHGEPRGVPDDRKGRDAF